MNEPELKAKFVLGTYFLELLKDISESQRNSIACVLIGHSRMVSIDFGRIHCARCNEMLVDGLVSVIDPRWEKTLVYQKCPHGPDCKICAENEKTLTWKDKIFVESHR